MKDILVADVMTRGAITVGPDTNLLECAKRMVRKKVKSLIIIDKKKIVGFISQQDILWALIKKSKEDLKNIRALDISPKKIATIRPNATIKEAMSKMKKFKFNKLPVVQDNEVVGMVAIKDILLFCPEVYPELDELAKIREQSRKLRRVQKADRIYEGICEECGSPDILHRFNGMLVCENCQNRS